MSDPAAFPMFKGGYPLTAAGKAGLAKWNPRNNILLKCGTKGTPLIMISPLPMEFSREGDKIIMRLEGSCQCGKVGFRVGPGLRDRVIYRELFPKGLTLLDLAELGEVGMGHITARQELREMIAGLGVPEPGASLPEPVAAAG
jgi:hypothetical protein